MSQFVVRVLRNGQVTIPQETRQMKDINEGDLVTLEVKEVKKA